jgi:hypothetical protein
MTKTNAKTASFALRAAKLARRSQGVTRSHLNTTFEANVGWFTYIHRGLEAGEFVTSSKIEKDTVYHVTSK